MYRLICDQKKSLGIAKFINFTAESESGSESKSESESHAQRSGRIRIRKNRLGSGSLQKRKKIFSLSPGIQVFSHIYLLILLPLLYFFYPFTFKSKLSFIFLPFSSYFVIQYISILHSPCHILPHIALLSIYFRAEEGYFPTKFIKIKVSSRQHKNDDILLHQ